MRLVLIDDLVTGFNSKILARQQVMHEMKRRDIPGVRCTDVAVLVDREQGGADAAAASGFRLHAAIPLRTQGLTWLERDLAEVEREVLGAYFDNPEPFMAPAEQKRLRQLARPADRI
jgi:orotate phosphoribosyltransferase